MKNGAYCDIQIEIDMRSAFSGRFGRGGGSKGKGGGGTAGECVELWKSEGEFESVWEGEKLVCGAARRQGL